MRDNVIDKIKKQSHQSSISGLSRKTVGPNSIAALKIEENIQPWAKQCEHLRVALLETKELINSSNRKSDAIKLLETVTIDAAIELYEEWLIESN